MSYLSLPRVSFVGRFLSDVSTRNNVAENYRKDGPLQDLWNVAGGAAFDLLDCRVCPESELDASDSARGYVVTGAVDRSSAKMVDLDPDWQMSSQLWGLQLRVSDPATGELALRGECTVTAFRDLWRRQFGSAVNGQPSGARFVTVLKDLEWGPAAARSPVLNQLRAVTESDRLSIGMHQFGYFYTQDHYRYRTGSVILHIGPYYAGEAETALVHRRIVGLALNNTPRPTTAVSDIDFTVEKDGSRAFVDFGHALPVSDVDGNLASFGLVHSDLTQLSALSLGLAPQPMPLIGAVVPANDLRLLFSLPSRPDWYRRTGGVLTVDVPVDLRSAMTAQPVALFGQFADGRTLLLATETEDGIFLRADDYVCRLDPGEYGSVRIHLRQWGRPLAGRTIHLARVSPEATAPGLALDPPPQTDSGGTTTLRLRAEDPRHPRVENDLDGQIFVVSYSHKLDTAGMPEIAGTGLGALDVVVAHVRDPFSVPVSPEFHADVQPFLAQYARLYPIMSKHLFDIADYDSLVRNRQVMLLAFNRDIRDPNYMPVTRDLSAAKIATLVKWLSTDTGDPDNPLRRNKMLATLTAPMPDNGGTSRPQREDVKTAMADTLRRAPRMPVLTLNATKR